MIRRDLPSLLLHTSMICDGAAGGDSLDFQFGTALRTKECRECNEGSQKKAMRLVFSCTILLAGMARRKIRTTKKAMFYQNRKEVITVVQLYSLCLAL